MHLKFELILIYNKAAMDNIFSNSSHLEWKVGLWNTFERGPSQPNLVWYMVQWFQRRIFQCDSLQCTKNVQWTDWHGRTSSDAKSKHGLLQDELTNDVDKTLHRKLKIKFE